MALKKCVRVMHGVLKTYTDIDLTKPGVSAADFGSYMEEAQERFGTYHTELSSNIATLEQVCLCNSLL